MSNTPQHDEIMAGEPVRQSRKAIPPLDGNAAKSTGKVNESSNNKKSLFKVLQSVTIIIALILSFYSFTIIESLDDSTGEDGADANEILIRTEGREADHICLDGGADIFIGSDANNNGILEEDEVTSTTRLCHGKAGLSGPQGANGIAGSNGVDSLVNISIIEFGDALCPVGGIQIASGQDVNANGQLDEAEVVDTEPICNGAMGLQGSNGNDGDNGHSALIERHNPPPHLCSNGIVINFGIDNGNGGGIADDGIMHGDEVAESLKVCSHPLHYGPISDFSIGATNGISNQCAEFAWSASNSMVVTTGSDGIAGCELWISDGTSGSMQRLADINPGSSDSKPGLHIGLNSVNYQGEELWIFDADNGANGRELWVTNLTGPGTSQLTGYSGDGILADSVAVPWMEGLIFTDSNHEFMWTNGVDLFNLFDAPFFTLDQQQILDSIQTQITSHASTTFAVDTTGLWFSAIVDNYGFEMHRLNNTGVFTSWDLNSFEDSMPNAILPMGDSAIVVADDGINGRQLAQLDGDGGHNWLTNMVLQSNGNPPTEVGDNLGLNLLGNSVIFDAKISSVDPTVWSYNLASGTLTELSSLMVAPGERVGAVTADGRVWFDCITATTAEELCVSDGTTTGTKVIHEFQPGLTSAEIRDLAVADGHLLVIANGQQNGVDTGHSIWSFDTNTLHAELVYDPWIGVGNNSDAGIYGDLYSDGQLILFAADDGISGHELHLWNAIALSDEWLIW